MSDQPAAKRHKKDKKRVEDLLAIAPGLICQPCNRDASLKTEKRFKWRLCLENQLSTASTLTADAWVLDNNIAVLMLDRSIAAKSVDFCKLNVDLVYGKMKKGAMRIQALQPIANIVTETDQTIELLSPISGRILELNDRLLVTPSLLASHHNTDGYLVLLQSDVPKLIDKSSGIEGTLDQLLDPNQQKLCFAWTKGACSRGDACKYLHSTDLVTIGKT